MRDGVTVFADVYRPSAEGKYPTIVIRTPYGVQRENSGIHDRLITLARSGYAIVNTDVRGRYESEGAWDPFRLEGKDGYDVVEWAAKQPWSTGKVATQGGSYLGHVQWATLGEQPPSLVAAFPAVASTNLYANWITQGGAFRLAFNFGWGVVRMPFRIMQPQLFFTGPDAAPELRYEQILKHLPLETMDERAYNHPVRHWRDWLTHESYDAYWKAVSDEERFARVQVPVMTQGGWFDVFLAGTINGYVGVRTKGANDRVKRLSRMVVGPWGHGPSRKYGDLDFGPDADRTLLQYQQRWNDYHLKGIDNGLAGEAPGADLLHGDQPMARRGGLADCRHPLHAVVPAGRREAGGRRRLRARAARRIATTRTIPYPRRAATTAAARRRLPAPSTRRRSTRGPTSSASPAIP